MSTYNRFGVCVLWTRELFLFIFLWRNHHIPYTTLHRTTFYIHTILRFYIFRRRRCRRHHHSFGRIDTAHIENSCSTADTTQRHFHPFHFVSFHFEIWSQCWWICSFGCSLLYWLPVDHWGENVCHRFSIISKLLIYFCNHISNINIEYCVKTCCEQIR